MLNVESSRLPRWHRPGLLLIGDAAHVMSPVGGVGINYAIQDAVVAANLLSAKLKAGKLLTSTTWPRCSGSASCQRGLCRRFRRSHKSG